MRRKAWIWALALVIVATLAACGADQDAAATNEGAEAASGQKAAADMTPDELGKAIGEVYVDSLTQVTDLMKDRPEPAELQPKVEALKASTIEKLVTLGRVKETMTSAERAGVDGATSIAMNKVPSAVFTAYAEGQSYYVSKDRDLANEIASFNIITQYASFDLLKKQAPDEAKRLGIE